MRVTDNLNTPRRRTHLDLLRYYSRTLPIIKYAVNSLKAGDGPEIIMANESHASFKADNSTQYLFT